MNKKTVAILFLGDYHYDARCVNMAHSLLKEKFKITVYHSSKVNTDTCDGNINLVNIDLINIKWFKYVFWVQKLSGYLSKSKFDVVIASDLYSLPAACCNKKNITNIVYDSREIYSSLSAHVNSIIKNTFLYLLEKYSIGYADSIITTAKSDEEYLKKLYPQYGYVQYYVIHNFPKTYTNHKTMTLKQKLKIDNQHKILLYQGVIQRGRGIKQMIRIVEDMQNVVGVLIGSGDALQYYKTLAQQSKAHKNIYFLNSIVYKQLLSFTKSADIGLAIIEPLGISNQFALPNKIFEYALCGVPVLASNLCNMKAYIKKFNLGKTAEADDTEQQINAIKILLHHNRKNIALQAAKHLSWEVQEEKFLKIIYN